jgi:hypothetical protein
VAAIEAIPEAAARKERLFINPPRATVAATSRSAAQFFCPLFHFTFTHTTETWIGN